MFFKHLNQIQSNVTKIEGKKPYVISILKQQRKEDYEKIDVFETKKKPLKIVVKRYKSWVEKRNGFFKQIEVKKMKELPNTFWEDF